MTIISKVIYNYPPNGRWIVVDIYQDANLPNQLGKTEKGTFCKLKHHCLRRNLVYSLQTFGGFCPVHFTILLQIQRENNFLPTSEHWQAKLKLVVFLVLILFFTTGSCIAQMSSSKKHVSKQDAILDPFAKQWITTDILSYGNQSKRAKIVLYFTDLVNTNDYCVDWGSCYLIGLGDNNLQSILFWFRCWRLQVFFLVLVLCASWLDDLWVAVYAFINQWLVLFLQLVEIHVIIHAFLFPYRSLLPST